MDVIEKLMEEIELLKEYIDIDSYLDIIGEEILIYLS